MKEFTFQLYRKIITGFIEQGYTAQTVKEYFETPLNKSLILRHDIDRFPGQAVEMANAEYEMGVHSTYYFRIKYSVMKKDIIKSIIAKGHEIGYHYDDLASSGGNYTMAINSFEKNLEILRSYYPVVTMCAHGKPLSPWNNSILWQKYDYRKYGIIADLSYDIDYDNVFYLTDNGFGWNKYNTSVRDKVTSKIQIQILNTGHLIKLIENNQLPQKILFNTHPDTFCNPGIRWYLNYLFIKSKNPLKWIIVKSGLIK